MKKILEKDIQRTIIEYLNYRKDVYFIRNNSFSGSFVRSDGSKGWLKNNKLGSPDLIICFKGNWIGCEVKAKDGKQSQNQLQAEADIIRAGGKYFIVRSVEEIIKILK